MRRKLGLMALAMAGAVLTAAGEDRRDLASRLTLVDASRTYAGACVGADTPTNCPATKNACETECNGKKAGDACAGSGYAQLNPSYRKTKDAASGKKSSKTASIICGNLVSCGPVCVGTAGGATCPVSTISDYQVESFPDPDSGDCAEEEAGQTEIARLGAASTSLFAASGGTFDAFAGR